MKKLLSIIVIAVFSCMSMYANDNVEDGDFQMLHGNYFYHGMKLNSRQVADFYSTNCPQAYREFKKGTGMFYSGVSVACAGVAVAAIGIAPAFKGNFVAAYSMLGAGVGVAAIVGVPLMFAGIGSRNTAYDLYNVNCKKKQTAELQFGAGADGIGLAIAF